MNMVCPDYLQANLVPDSKVVYQGGDWGHIISIDEVLSGELRTSHIMHFLQLGIHVVNKHGHKHVKAFHSNMPV